jgi:hypothetical protein
MPRLIHRENFGAGIIFPRIFGNKLLAMSKEEQDSPFIHKETQITPLSSLPLRGAILYHVCPVDRRCTGSLRGSAAIPTLSPSLRAPRSGARQSQHSPPSLRATAGSAAIQTPSPSLRAPRSGARQSRHPPRHCELHAGSAAIPTLSTVIASDRRERGNPNTLHRHCERPQGARQSRKRILNAKTILYLYND